MPRFWDYLWVAEDGMKMQGYNGSQLWDCAFAVQAIEATGLAKNFNECLRDAAKYIDDSQVRDDAPELKKYYRHISKGAWPFSTRDHGWPISDCSSEGLKAALSLMDMEDQGLIKIDPKKQNSSRSISGLRKCDSELSKHAKIWVQASRKRRMGDVRKHSSR